MKASYELESKENILEEIEQKLGAHSLSSTK